MKAEGHPLRKLFNGVIRYEVPLFQRPYVWSMEKNWDPLWEDICGLAEKHLLNTARHKHFIGAIVLDRVATQTGDIETRQVIDGQQRLTTLQLVLAAARDICQALKLDKLQGRFRTFTENGEDFRDEPDDIFKVWPTNRDQESFRKTMKAESSAAVRALINLGPSAAVPSGGIGAAYLYFYGKMEGWLTRQPADGSVSANGVDDDPIARISPEDRADALWRAISEYLRIVVIDLEPDDDAQVIFETLNARGTQLLPADLVKNYLFHQIQRTNGNVELIYDECWKDFDHDFWRKEVRQGRLKRPRIDLFLQHFLALKTRGEVNVGHIFDVYQEYAQETEQSAEALIREFSAYGGVCRKLFSPPQGTYAETFFYRLNLIDTSTVLPLLLEVFHRLPYEQHLEEVNQVLLDVESFLVRRIMCNLTTKKYNAVFLDVLKACEDNGGVTGSSIRQYLLTRESETNRWPDDAAFRESFKTNQVYWNLTRAKLRMILEAIDLAMETQMGEQITIQSTLTIEHLLPESWEQNWPLPELSPEEQQSAIERRNHLKQTIGNLTLLTQKLNSSVSNGPWDQKRPKIAAQTKLNMNQRLATEETWNEDRILARSDALFEVARSIWPYPVLDGGSETDQTS